MDYNELYNEYKDSGLSLSAFAKKKGLDKGNLWKAFKKLQQPTTGVVNVVNENTTGVVPVVNCEHCEKLRALEKELEDERETIHVTTDCSTCEKTAELSKALLENAELQEQIEKLKTPPAPPVDCTACEKLRAVEKELEGGKEKYQQQRTAEAERIKEIEKSAEEWEQRAKEWESTAEEYKKEGEQKIKFWASIAAAALLLFITTLIFAIIK